MSPTFGLVKDITPSDTHWALRLRLLRVYENISDTGDIRGLECVFHDKEGALIHATIRMSQMAKYRQLLKERSLYAVRRFIVAIDGKKCRTTDNKFKMIFYEKTEVIYYEDDAFPNHVYKFKGFESLLNARIIDESELFDVIGQVVSKKAVREVMYQGRPHRLIEVTLQDPRLNQLSCTFWDNFVDQILPYIGDDQTEPVIVTLQFCRAGIFRGEPKISTNYNVTRVVINGDDVEFQEFKNSLQEVNVLTQPIRTVSVTTDRQMSISEELESLEQPLKTIEELYEIQEVGSFWISAKVVAIESDKNWWYLSCTKCRKKLEKTSSKFYCTKCDKPYSDGIPRYKVILRVIDSTGNAPLLIWDDVGQEMFGKDAVECQNMMLSSGRQESYVPAEIEAVVDVSMLFKVQIKKEQIGNYNSAFSVMKFTRDEALIEKFNVNGNDEQESDFISKMHHVDSHCEKAYSSQGEVSTPDHGKANNEGHKSSSAGEKLKRDLIGDSSCNSSSKKMRKIVKLEK